MQQAGQDIDEEPGEAGENAARPEPSRPKAGRAERRRVETVVETLATLRGQGETLAEVAHDARNMVTALGLYCDLLEEPGVLTTPFMHYGHELRLVAAASRRLVERIVMIDAQSFDEQIPGARAPARGVSMTGLPGPGPSPHRLPVRPVSIEKVSFRSSRPLPLP